MAIVQISRITQRQGLTENLPQLAGGEFGWAVDSRRLFIGNGTLANGAPAIGNTEVLTEYSDILDLASSYTYKGEAGGYTVQTGPTTGSPVTRSLQAVFDDYASIKDFITQEDIDANDYTAAINRALYQLYCRQPNNTATRRSLFFPAGTYRVTDTILIPPYARLIGEGANSSIIQFSALDYNSAFSYLYNALVFNGTDYYRAIQNVPAGTSLSNTAYWDSLGDLIGDEFYVARTTDSNQQTNGDIDPAIGPQLVEISDMAFSTQHPVDIFLLEQVSQVSVQSCNFYGPFETINESTTDDVACIRFASITAAITNHVTFDSCRFYQMPFAVKTDEEIQGIVFSNSKFDTLYQGVVLGENILPGGGPTGVRITQSLFDQIYYQGIIFGSSANKNVSGYNIFLNVGNKLQGSTFPGSPIIDIQADNNVSVGDMFERNDVQDAEHARIATNNYQVFALDNGARYKFGSYCREAGATVDLPATAGAIYIPNFEVYVNSQFDSFIMEYRYRSITNGTTRYGRMTIVGVASTGSGTLAYSDDYTENGDTGLTLTPVQVDLGNGPVIKINYTAPVDSGSLSYSLSHF